MSEEVKGWSVGGEVQVSSASVRAHGQISAASIGKRLSLEPSYSHELGERISARLQARRKNGMWLLESTLVGATAEEHLKHLLDRLPPADVWIAGTQGAETDVCFHVSTNGGNSGFVLSRELMKRMAQFELSLSVDIWVREASD